MSEIEKKRVRPTRARQRTRCSLASPQFPWWGRGRLCARRPCAPGAFCRPRPWSERQCVPSHGSRSPYRPRPEKAIQTRSTPREKDAGATQLHDILCIVSAHTKEKRKNSLLGAARTATLSDYKPSCRDCLGQKNFFWSKGERMKGRRRRHIRPVHDAALLPRRTLFLSFNCKKL